MFSRNYIRNAVVALSGIHIATSQFVPAPTDLISKEGYAGINVRYKEVPTGICELNPNVKSYSGYADVDENQHIFWWFFEARNQDPKDAPLTVWINGGPGSSSMIGLFQENGPCGVDIDGKVYDNPYSWSNASNMLFIDQPTQVGFSYSIPTPGYIEAGQGQLVLLPDNTCPDYAADQACGTYSNPNQTLTANSTPAAAPNFYKTLQGFMGAFPDYSREEFFFATESYGGHYGPIFNEYILEQNALCLPGTKNISLAGVLIGNGWFDPLIQYEAFYNYTVFPGNSYDYFPFNDTVATSMYNAMWGPGNCYDMISDCYINGTDQICSYADNFCYKEVEYVLDAVAGRDEYDVRELTPDPFPYNFYVDYLNTPKVQSAIGAYVNFSDSNSAVSTAFGTTGDDGRVLTAVSDTIKLVEADLTVILYFGDADYVCNWLGGEVVANNIAAPGYAEAGFTNISTSDSIVHGQVKQAGKFSFVRIYESGHEVPFYQPLAALEMFQRAVDGLDIATGKVEVGAGYKTVGTPKSDYHEGNGTIQWDLVPKNATYNVGTGKPDPWNTTAAVVSPKWKRSERPRRVKRSMMHGR